MNKHELKRVARVDLGRRQFLKKVGTGAATAWALTALGVPSGRAAEDEERGRRPEHSEGDNFGRMFRLAPFAAATDTVRAALTELGKPGGILDAKDDLAKGPILLITDLTLSNGNRNNPEHTAGTTFMGQFLDHDMTFDQTTRLGIPAIPRRSPNARIPIFDLDSVYGGGPADSPSLYRTDDRIKFLVENSGLFEDLPRNSTTNAAIIADPRNDENLIISGLQAALLKFHNNAVDLVRAQHPRINNYNAFHRARRLAIWHYQWMILHEFLPSFVGQPMVDTVLKGGRKYYRPREEAFIPVEFQIGYRFGHSMIRPSYRANLAGDNGKPFFGMVFEPAGQGQADPIDLRGGARAPRRFIGWQTFFNFPGFEADVRPNKRIDTKISTPLFNLPLQTIFSGTPPTSLMTRNLLRTLTWEVPSGQAIAKAMGVPQLSNSDLGELKAILPSFVESTPLFYYILKEAELMEDGLRLGPVGGRIVAEVFIGLLQLDDDSYLNSQRNWLPTLPTFGGTPESFRMIDFLKFAGVDPATRGQ
ncbi:MAG: peroxidase family protein [Candidatus Binatia bacterium]